MKRVIELLRVSTAGQAAEDKASLPTQRAINRRTAEMYGLSIVKTIELSDVSGAQVLLTPEIQQMIQLMNDPEIHGVIVREFSRLMRPENFADYAMLQAFVDSETLLYLPDGPIDFASDTGMLTGTMRAVMGGMERRALVKKMWQIKEQKRREGGFSQSKVCLPFGVGFNDAGWFYTGDASRVSESYRILLAGDTSYSSIGGRVGIKPYNLRNILRNPIYTGWRVIDKRRDPSPKAKRAAANGRQGDRPKIKRAPEDVIRVKVLEPLVSESDFNQTQRILDLKVQNRWRMNSNPHRFTYNGFLLCGECRSLLYTKYRRDDYYICKVKCGASYQRRDRLDPQLDELFTERLTRRRFLARMLKAMNQKQPKTDVERLQAQIKSLDAKRQRILDGYFEGVINGSERDLRQADVARERAIIAGMVKREPRQAVTLDSLVGAFAPFMEFDLLNREDKRAILNTLTPSIVVSVYAVRGLFIGLEGNHVDTVYDAAERIWLPMAA